MSNELMDQFGQSGTSSIVAIAVGILFLLLYFYKSKVKDRIFYVNKPMQLRIFLLCTVMLMSTQQVFSWMSIGYEAALNLIGYTSMDAIESASEISYTVSMFLYASIFGPIAEEVVYRGFVMRNMLKCGRVFAIVVSSVLFGAMHGNMMQSIYAFTAGLVFAYVAVEYSIKWSILLHIINNMIFGDLLGYLLAFFSESTQNMVYFIINMGFFIGGIIILFLYRNKIKEYLHTYKAPTKSYRYAFTAILCIVFLVMEFVACLSGVEKLCV